MAEGYEAQFSGERFFADINTRLRDLEEKQRVLRDRVLLISESFVKEREKDIEDIRAMKKIVEVLKIDNLRIKEIIMRMAEKVNSSARKEDFMILQRQLNMFRD